MQSLRRQPATRNAGGGSGQGARGAAKELSKLSESWNGTRTSDMSYKVFHSTAYNLTGDPDPAEPVPPRSLSADDPRARSFYLATTPPYPVLSFGNRLTNVPLPVGKPLTAQVPSSPTTAFSGGCENFSFLIPHLYPAYSIALARIINYSTKTVI